MTQIALGFDGFTEQPVRRQKPRGKSWVRIRTWKGPRSGLEAFLPTVEELDPEDINVSEGTPAIIEASFSDENEDPEANAIWELRWTPIEKPIGTHGFFQPMSGNLTALGAQEAIQKAVRDGTAYGVGWDDIYDGYSFYNAQDFANLLMKGTDTWRTWVPVMRQTLSVGVNSNYDFNSVTAGQIVLYDAIDKPESISWAQPSLWLYDPSLPDGESKWAAKLCMEWLEQPAEVTYKQRRNEVTREWIGAVRWYTALYYGGGANSGETGFE